jgi:hypothetical protein
LKIKESKVRASYGENREKREKTGEREKIGIGRRVANAWQTRPLEDVCQPMKRKKKVEKQ